MLNAVQERRLVLFPDGTWAFVGDDGRYVEPGADRDLILNAAGTEHLRQFTQQRRFSTVLHQSQSA